MCCVAKHPTSGRFAASIGSTNVHLEEYLFDTISDNTEDPLCLGELNLDSYFASAAHTDTPKGISADQLIKVWRIDMDYSKRTLDVTTQRFKRSADPTLSRNYSTNDQMLRYKRIGQLFFIDTFFATKKSGRSSRGNNCCQLFVSNKGFVFLSLSSLSPMFLLHSRYLRKKLEIQMPSSATLSENKSQKQSRRSAIRLVQRSVILIKVRRVQTSTIYTLD